MTEPKEVDELSAKPELVHELFKKLMKESIEGWMKLAEERLKGTGDQVLRLTGQRRLLRDRQGPRLGHLRDQSRGEDRLHRRRARDDHPGVRESHPVEQPERGRRGRSSAEDRQDGRPGQGHEDDPLQPARPSDKHRDRPGAEARREPEARDFGWEPRNDIRGEHRRQGEHREVSASRRDTWSHPRIERDGEDRADHVLQPGQRVQLRHPEGAAVRRREGQGQVVHADFG